jgi:hypothetical protein
MWTLILIMLFHMYNQNNLIINILIYKEYKIKTYNNQINNKYKTNNIFIHNHNKVKYFNNRII